MPAGDGTQRNEHTTWLTQDRHAEAYRVLLVDPRSHQMVARLGYEAAHKEPRCLVCHTNPDLLSDTSTAAAEERSAGIGCETCHGRADKWLDPHTGWFRLDDAEKKKRFEEHGMTWLRGPRERAAQCVRCHIGTGGKSDVNHDLIAAGHPRLEFELTTFLANMPKHWSERDKKPDLELDAWAVGQVETARAGLRLLQTRAADKAKPWPELAEYDCFACHHDLRAQSWRRLPTRFQHGRAPGRLPWNGRYLSLLPGLVEKPPDLTDKWAQLVLELAKPLPDRDRVVEQARNLLKLLDSLSTKPMDAERFKALVEFLTGASSPARSDWDAAAQVYLALAALRPDANNAASSALRELGDLLAFSPGMNSPGTFRENDAFDKRLDQALDRIRQTFLPQR
jgi:hypothetical protein